MDRICGKKDINSIENINNKTNNIGSFTNNSVKTEKNDIIDIINKICEKKGNGNNSAENKKI